MVVRPTAMPRYYLTTAIDYVNSRPHLGTAYEKIAADVIARYKRLCGADVRFVMGNDEHSQNVFKEAAARGLDPLAYCDEMEHVFRKTWARLDVSFDDFIRTTEPRHRAGVTEIAKRVHQAGDIYEGVYEGWYCVSCEEFKQEKDLVDGNCPLHPSLKPEWIREKNYFFRLSKYQQPLLDHFAAHHEFMQPDIRRNEILRLIEGGLIDVSVSRAGQSWGIPLPWEPSSVVYVWFDALVNYASAVGLGSDAAMFEQWWPADLHVIGKDITRFHAVIWPAMLLAARLPLPRQVFGHGFMTLNGQRMSKTLGTIVDPIVAADRRGVDPLRLYLIKEIAFGGDGDFSWDRYDERYNVDLANNLGNLVSRVTAMAERYRRGRLLGPGYRPENMANIAESLTHVYRHAMDQLALEGGAAAAFRLVDATNEFIAEREPWAIARDEGRATELDAVLWDATEALRVAAVLLSPIMPSSAAEIFSRLGLSDADIGGPFARLVEWRADGERQTVRKDALWPRLEEATAGTPRPSSKEITTVTDQPTNPAPGPAGPAPDAPMTAARPAPLDAAAPVSQWPAENRISLDDFMKIDLRVAKVLAAERVANSKKLVKMQIDLGSEQRTLVAGIAEAYQADALVGRQVVIVANLKPAKLMGIESNGMVLAASPDGGKPILVGFDEGPPPGTRVR
jgi:methionyl-tRNA synthetase